MLGKPSNTVVEEEKLALAASGNDNEVYSRMLFFNLKVNSCKWNKKHHQKNNSVIGYSLNPETIEYGIIQKIFLINKDSSPMVLVMVSKLVKHDAIKVQTNSSPCTSVHHIVACFPPSQNPDVIVIPL